MIFSILNVMGVNRSRILSTKSWLTGLDSESKLLPESARAVLRIYFDCVYRNFTKVSMDNIKFNSWRVRQEICRDLMIAILAYQAERHNFSLLKRLSKSQHILPLSAASQVAPIGSLNVHSGHLLIKPSFIAIMTKYKMWTGFDPHE